MRSKPMILVALLLTFGSLSDRFGRKGMLLAGLVVFGTASLAGGFTTDPAQLIVARSVMGLGAAMTFPALSYGIIAVQMVLYGLGLGLTSAPATESIMGAISRAKAGVGSAVNDSTRLIGGTLGVAVIGSVSASVYGSRLTATLPASVPGRVAAIAHQSVGAAYVAAGKIAADGHPALGQALQHTAADAFLRGLTISCLVAAGAAEHAAALDLLAGGRDEQFAAAAAALIGQGDYALALEIIQPGLLRHPASSTLAGLRRTALHRLMEQHQQFDPFKFLIYAELAGAELGPVG